MSNNLHKKRIDHLLVEKGLAESKTKAQAMIMAHQVYIDEKLIKKSGELCLINSKIIIKNNKDKWVSRGSLKIEPIIIDQKIDIKEKICLDIGSSTGGFTQVLLKHGAKKIYAVDVGYGQLHEKIAKNSRVLSFERTNARYLTSKTIKEDLDIIVCDASFIGFKKVINESLNFLKFGGQVIGLIKPQFEALKHEVKKNGVIKDKFIHERICNNIQEWLIKEKTFEVAKIVQSPIKGPKGNIEFFITATKKF